MIPYGKQEITDKDIIAVTEALKHDYLTQGPKVEEFENLFSNYIGSKYAIAVSNGTAALHLCSLALGVNKKSKVLTTPISFVSTSNCIEFCNGRVEFIDINKETLCMDIDLLKNRLENAYEGEFSGIIPVNFGGYPIDMQQIRELSIKHNLWIIEDACHSPGGYFKDKKGQLVRCGNGKYADLSIFSFHPVKHIATGEGGMITTNNKELYDKIKLLRTHGITKDENQMARSDGDWFYEMQLLGYNYRIPDILCSLGVSQLSRANQNLLKRKRIAKKYIEAFKKYKNQISIQKITEGHAYHLFIIQVDKRKELFNYLKSKKIFTQIHYIPIYEQPYYINKYGNQFFKYSDNYYSKCLSLPIYPSMSDEEQNFVINSVIEFINEQ